MASILHNFYNYFFLITVLFYNFFPKKARPWYLLLCSWFFFFLLSKKLVIFLILSIISIFISGLIMTKLEKNLEQELTNCTKENKKVMKRKYQKKKQMALIGCLLFNLLFLFLFKYLNFFTLNANHLLALFHVSYRFNMIKLFAPIGISFYTLQALSYIIDVYQNKIKASSNFLEVALFTSFFPCIMEGPICRFPDTAKNLIAGEKITFHNLSFGLERILWGMLKKFIIADRLNILVKTVFANDTLFSGPTIFLGAFCYTIMLYMDFSGAMDVVIGIGEIYNVKIPENFRQPFFSKNISEFWTRWHISLGTWFKDYIYYPISLSKPMKKLTLKCRKLLGHIYGPLLSGTISLLVVWLLNGLWHGAGWTFILYGLFHFLMISLGNITRPLLQSLYQKWHISNSFLLKILQIIKTNFLIILGELIFRAESVHQAFQMYHKIFTNFTFSQKEFSLLGVDFPDVFILTLFGLLVLVIGILREKKIGIRSRLEHKNIFIRWIVLYLLIFSIIIFGAFGPGYEPVDPMYADF